MKIAVISDIHSNYEALTSTIAEIERREISTILCLGDIVGYGANPNECVELIRTKNITVVAGNHDKAVTGELSIAEFSENAQTAIRWTYANIRQHHREYLSTLSYTHSEYNVLFTHGSPDYPETFRYLFRATDALNSFIHFREQLCFVGHTHSPALFCEDMHAKVLEQGKRFIINPGSVGQPRDGNWHASFAIYDMEAYNVEFVRVPYDVHTARNKILDVGLPRQLGDRLLVGV